MVAHALLGIFVMGCLVYLMESHVVRCPEQAEWNIRAEIQCQNTTNYFCLYNDINYNYKEGCTGPDWDRPGSKRVYSRNFNRAPCKDTRYQPIKFVTNGNSDCIFRKSLCTEEGQTLFSNGTTRTDSTCRCDYTQGYAFVTVPRSKCYCRPSEEDCSCYLKKCPGIGYYLSADYECTKNSTKKTVCSFMSENPSEDPHFDMAPTGTPRENDSYVIRRKFDVVIVVLVCIFGMIVITMRFMFHQRLPRCPQLSTKQACTAETERMDTGPSLNTIEQNASNDESAVEVHIESGRMDAGPSLDTIDQNVTNDQTVSEVITMSIMLRQRLARSLRLSTEQSTPTVTVPDPTYSVNRGSAITLECSYSANPPATQVRWRKDNVDLGDTAGNAKYGGSTISSASLIIYNAAESDEGTYVCTVTNTVGTGISTTTTLDVVGNGNRLEEIVSGNNEDNQIASSDKLKDNIHKEGLETALKQFNEDLDNWKNEPVKLAITGKSGVGKSSFINAIRNLKSGDPDFATSSGSGNTTTKPTIYEYPGNPNITLHDLPGFGTIELPTNEYEKRMELHKYDYILMFVGNIDENDIEIAKTLKEMKKPFCFVRSKIDIDILNAEKDGESEIEIVEKIMSKLSGNLKHAGFNKTKFFVISNHNRRICQFNNLVSYIESNLPGLKYQAFMFSILGELSVDEIESKYKILKDRILKVSVASVSLSIAPIFGMDMMINLALLCKELLLYHKTFGFEQQFVKEILKDDFIRQKLNVSSIIEIQPTNEAMHTFVKIELEKLRTSEARESPNDLIVPFIESVVSVWPAGEETFRLLIQVLDGCRDDSKLVYSHLMSVDV